MGKIVKYCAACEESFAEKFAFCPNCGQQMTAFEMNPVNSASKPAEEPEANHIVSERLEESSARAAEFSDDGVDDILEIPTPAPIVSETSTPIETSKLPETTNVISASAPTQTSFTNENIEELNTEELDTEAEEEKSAPATKTFAAAAGASNGNFDKKEYQTAQFDSQNDFHRTKAKDDFHITVIQEKNVKQRNLLLLGSMGLVIMLLLGGTVYSLFTKSLLVGAIDEGNPFYIGVVDDVPMQIEDPPKPEKKKDDGGGGGGGGRDEQTPTSQGRLATQTLKPEIAPTKTIVQKDFELKQIASTEGSRRIPPTNQPYGDPNSRYTLSSDGTGTGGGQGSGVGTGQGSGRGTGQGSGIGSGSGSGRGSGDGSGSGDGGPGTRNPPPPPPPAATPRPVVTEPFKIISRPKPPYTDAARQNQVTGVVRLRVTFSASGAVGNITPISGLPYGLTEQAISAARQIRFEPEKKNGVPVATTRIIEYSFSIY